MSVASVPQPGPRCLVGQMTPGLDVRVVAGKYRGARGFVVGFQPPKPRDSRTAGWLVYLPQRGEGVTVLPWMLTPDYPHGNYPRQVAERGR